MLMEEKIGQMERPVLASDRHDALVPSSFPHSLPLLPAAVSSSRLLHPHPHAPPPPPFLPSYPLMNPECCRSSAHRPRHVLRLLLPAIEP
ncbi:hypothetical protein EYF80_034775 [Liparis tanakae]|uniref:Uncharacterized protein n=1 Tax=Liparis tanakae TaxID=230148 RepID=A0A4Z2GMZ0_9TELE|nr:hypothetical protein EYF80_034775 [Liparis tanakae]